MTVTNSRTNISTSSAKGKRSQYSAAIASNKVPHATYLKPVVFNDAK